MKRFIGITVWILIVAGVRLSALAQWTTQTITLQPGWNAVYLEVQPRPEECDALFAGLPVESVWDFNPSVDSPQFVQDPSTLLPGAPDWLTWFPPDHPLADQGNLYILRDGRPYLIKLRDNAQPVAWTVTGRPSLRRIAWQADSLNFVGFHVAAQAPTFQTLFAGESGLAGQPVFSLDVGGVWRQVGNLGATRPKAGASYWVRCQSPAQRTATIEVDSGSRTGINFAESINEVSLRVRNTSSSPRNVSLRLLPSAAPPEGQPPLAGPVPLEYYDADYAAAQFDWKPLAAPVTFASLQPNAEWNLRLAARRASASPGALAGSEYQSLLEVTDDLGTRWLVPVSAETMTVASAATLGLRAAANNESVPFTGLWVGDAVINSVSQPSHPTDANLPRPSGGEFSFRLLLHADAEGKVRLLQHVFLVRKPPTLKPDPDNPGFNLVDQPARTLVVTDESLIPQLIGTGEITGRRLSTAAFAFDQPILLTGDGAFGDGAHSATITLDYQHPRNPFKHLYHPDHNNLDERFEQTLPEGKESFTVTRALTLEFTAEDPLGLNPPGWGDSEIGGNYNETITGLHRQPIHIGGYFRLVRVTPTAALNDGQNASLASARTGGR